MIATMNESKIKARVRKKSVRVPIFRKVALTIKEAAAYSNIGMNRIDAMLRSPDCSFVLFVGKKKLVKRKEFEEFIHNQVDV